MPKQKGILFAGRLFVMDKDGKEVPNHTVSSDWVLSAHGMTVFQKQLSVGPFACVPCVGAGVAIRKQLAKGESLGFEMVGEVDQHEQAESLWDGILRDNAGLKMLDERIHTVIPNPKS